MTKHIEKNFKSKLTKKDYFLYLINRNTFILLSPLIIISLVVVFAFMVKKDGFDYRDLLYLLPIILFILSYIQIYNAVNRAIKSNTNEDDLKIIIEEKKYREITQKGENYLEYNKFYSYYESKNYYYLYVDKVNALILPKREFSQEELTKINSYFSSSMKRASVINFRTITGVLFSIGLIACSIFLLASI